MNRGRAVEEDMALARATRQTPPRTLDAMNVTRIPSRLLPREPSVAGSCRPAGLGPRHLARVIPPAVRETGRLSEQPSAGPPCVPVNAPEHGQQALVRCAVYRP